MRSFGIVFKKESEGAFAISNMYEVAKYVVTTANSFMKDKICFVKTLKKRLMQRNINCKEYINSLTDFPHSSLTISLQTACTQRRSSEVKRLIEKKANVNVTDSVNRPDQVREMHNIFGYVHKKQFLSCAFRELGHLANKDKTRKTWKKTNTLNERNVKFAV